MQHVYIIGSKSIGLYGGFESFVKKLLECHKDNKEIKYHVACKANGEGYMDLTKLPEVKILSDKEFEYCGADCFLIDIPEKLGPAQAIYYDVSALKWCCDHIEKKHIERPIVYVLASRIGPFEKKYAERIHRAGGLIYQNPDGHEDWRRKWPWIIRRYWKFSERLMIKNCDLAVCDSKNIEKYILTEYKKYNPKTTYIAYGSEINPSKLSADDPKYIEWLNKNGLRDGEFYISVGRFVPENNFEIMIREFMNSKSKKDFAIITTKNEKLFKKLDRKLKFSKDKRIKFVGTVYDKELLKRIRENAYGYIHGHEVGGTNPSLLEALGLTKLNLLLDVGFNREVAEGAAIYWLKDNGNLANLIEYADKMSTFQIKELGNQAKKRIILQYNWEYICWRYAEIFLIVGEKSKLLLR